MLRFRLFRLIVFKGSPAHVGALSRPDGSRPVSGQLCETTNGGLIDLISVSCRLSAAGVRFLGILSRPGIPPLLRSAYHASQRGPERVFHVPHARDTAGAGCPLYPGDCGAFHGQLISLTAACRLPAAGPYSPR